MARELMCRCGCGRRLPVSQVMVSRDGVVTCDACLEAMVALHVNQQEAEEAERLEGIRHERELQEATDEGIITI